MNIKNIFFLNHFKILLIILDNLSNEQKKFKKKFYVLIFIIILTSVFEIFGIGIIFPVFDIFSQYEKSKYFQYLSFLKLDFKKELLLLYLLFFIGIIFLLKNILILFSINYINKFFHKLEVEISENILKNYISENNLKNFSNDLSVLFKNARTEVIFFCELLKSHIIIIKEIIILIFLLIFSILLQPLYFLLCFFLIGLTGILLNIYSKKMLNSYGVNRALHEGRYFHYILSFISGLKEISLFRSQDFFYKKIKYHLNNFNSLLRKKIIFANSPKYIFEIFGIFFLILLVLLNYFFINKPVNVVIPMLIFYIIIFYRILPSVSSINANLVTLNYNNSALNIISKEIINKKKILKDVKIIANYVNKLEINDSVRLLNFYFSYDEKLIFENTNLEIKKNQLTILSGASGSGKSTVVKLLLCSLSPTRGGLFIDDVEITKENKSRYIDKISAVYQDSFIMNDTILTNITFEENKKKIDWERLYESCKNAEILDFCNSLPAKFETIIGEKGEKISGGQKQRLAIARALYFKKDLLILDESTNALDKKTEIKIIENLSQIKSMTIFCVGHKLENSLILKNFYEIKEKKIIKIK
jgi:ABC-type multidrug transport system fused ATPase/permease subunit